MIGHDHPGEKPISLLVIFHERGPYNFGDRTFPQKALTMTAVHILLCEDEGLALDIVGRPNLQLFADLLEENVRKRVVKTAGDELRPG
jgi:hypothetical protein